MLKSFSAGIILGVALLHLMDDATDKLNDVSPKPSELKFGIESHRFMCFG